LLDGALCQSYLNLHQPIRNESEKHRFENLSKKKARLLIELGVNSTSSPQEFQHAVSAML